MYWHYRPHHQGIPPPSTGTGSTGLIIKVYRHHPQVLAQVSVVQRRISRGASIKSRVKCSRPLIKHPAEERQPESRRVVWREMELHHLYQRYSRSEIPIACLWMVQYRRYTPYPPLLYFTLCSISNDELQSGLQELCLRYERIHSFVNGILQLLWNNKRSFEFHCLSGYCRRFVHSFNF